MPPVRPVPTTRPAVTKAPLTKRMRPGHWMAIDCAVGAIVALSAMFLLSSSFGPPLRERLIVSH